MASAAKVVVCFFSLGCLCGEGRARGEGEEKGGVGKRRWQVRASGGGGGPEGGF